MVICLCKCAELTHLRGRDVRYIVFTYLLEGRKKNNNRSSGYKMIVLTNIYRKFIDSDPNVVSV